MHAHHADSDEAWELKSRRLGKVVSTCFKCNQKEHFARVFWVMGPQKVVVPSVEEQVETDVSSDVVLCIEEQVEGSNGG
ncbi:hypothetical protein NDU88_005353 [Pleurodeles waltl]|uniref:Uncharacterized protein n=1 Tax=Pleurodeles waltl TaxID=8319 RepID=A0AAV7WA70_PLEWA|nr:hypothetical protein NDU88_005353 [Pleurodeles waltl]